jgi:inosine-uridine nucleoside N-ribohydrolase
MYKVISKQKEKVHIVATAQLTNVALLLILYPEIKEKIASIVLMGGAIGMGNTSPSAEFNIEVLFLKI